MTEPSPSNARTRAHSATERIADSYVHGAGLGAALAGAGALIAIAAERADVAVLAAIVVYAVCLCAMVLASAAYNFGYGSRFQAAFQRLDHAAIFLLIAGTCTPFIARFYAGFVALALIVGVWVVSLVCIALKIFRERLFNRVSVLLYLLFGWGAPLALAPIMPRLPPFALTTLVAGGLLYTIGVIFHLRQSMPFHNAVWHVFVLLAAASHYGSIFSGVAWPPA